MLKILLEKNENLDIYQGCICKLLDENEILSRKKMDILTRAEQQAKVNRAKCDQKSWNFMDVR